MLQFFVFGVVFLGLVNDIFGQGDLRIFFSIFLNQNLLKCLQNYLAPYITKCGRKNYEQCVIAQHKKVIKNMQFGK